MGLWNIIIQGIIEYGKRRNEEVEEEYERTHSDYDNPFDGEWVRKGNRRDDNWEWVEKENNMRTMYVYVLQEDKHYTIQVDYEPDEEAIETCKCDNMTMVQDAIDLCRVYYKVLGTVTIDNKL